MLTRLTNSTFGVVLLLNNARKRRACQFITDKGRKKKIHKLVMRSAFQWRMPDCQIQSITFTFVFDFFGQNT